MTTYDAFIIALDITTIGSSLISIFFVTRIQRSLRQLRDAQAMGAASFGPMQKSKVDPAWQKPQSWM